MYPFVFDQTLFACCKLKARMCKYARSAHTIIRKSMLVYLLGFFFHILLLSLCCCCALITLLVFGFSSSFSSFSSSSQVILIFFSVHCIAFHFSRVTRINTLQRHFMYTNTVCKELYTEKYDLNCHM